MNRRGSISLSCKRVSKVSPRNSKIVLQPLSTRDPPENFKEIFLDGNNVYSLQHHRSQEHIILNSLQVSPRIKISSPEPEALTLKIERKPRIGKQTVIEKLLSSSPESIPPYIRKLERFMTKLDTLSKRPTIKPQIAEMESKYLSPKFHKSVRDRPSGMPARFKEISTKKNYVSQKSVHQDGLRIKKDLNIIKITDGIDLKERLEIAKLVRKYEDINNKDSILKNKDLEESWRWYTPGNTPTNKSVHFDMH